METKQLANVLIKILGLYFFLNGICDFLVYLPTSIWMGTTSPTTLTLISLLGGFIPNVLQIVFSIILIAKCNTITRILFKDETAQSP